MENVYNQWDEKAKEWDADPAKIERSGIIADKIVETIGPISGLNALEYGCGTGMVSFFLQLYFKTILLADSSKGMLEVAKSKIAQFKALTLSTLEVDFTQYNPIKKQFGCVYTMLTLHHVVDIKSILTTFYLLLEENGFFFIADLDREDGSFHGQGFEGHHGFDRSELRAHCTDAGFSDVTFTTVCTIQRESVHGQKREYPLFLMSARKR